MAKQQVKSGLAAKLGNRIAQAVKSHAGDEVDYGGGATLPAGVIGIARLTKCGFSKYKTGKHIGEFFFMAMGTVVEPVMHPISPGNLIKVQGSFTQIGPEAVCDTPEAKGKKKTLDDHIASIQNELRKLGVDTEGMDSGDDLETAAATLEEEAPYFRFETWIGKATPEFPNPTVNHKWLGVVDYTGGPTDDVVDRSADFVPNEEADLGQVEGDEPEDLEALGVAADEGDEGAMTRLNELALAADIDPDVIPSWAEVATMLSGTAEPEVDETTNGEATAPAKGQVWYYKPPKARKAVECEVTAVFDKSQLVNLKNLDDGKSIKSVPWTALQETA